MYGGGRGGTLNPRQKMMIVIPVVAATVILLVYFGLFASPVVIVAIFVLYVAVSLWNRKKFNKQRGGRKEGEGTPSGKGQRLAQPFQSPSRAP
jgi:hypothetical protein